MAKRNRTTSAIVAAEIRKELKKNGVKGSVRSSNYTGGSSVRVVLENPLPAVRDAVDSFTSKYLLGSFNSMEDIYEYRKDRDPDAPYVNYVFVESNFSDDIREAAKNYLIEGGFDVETYGLSGFEYHRAFHRVLAEGDSGFWKSLKPKVKVAAIAA